MTLLIDMRLEHAEASFASIVSLQSGQFIVDKKDKDLILQGLYVEGKSWQELQDGTSCKPDNNFKGAQQSPESINSK
jgi:hypothetical protein